MEMKDSKFSISEIQNLVSKNDLKSLPLTVRAIQYRAEKENWEFEEVPTQGGKNGLKKIYTLPTYVVEELEKKGLLHLIGGAETNALSVPHTGRPKTAVRQRAGITEPPIPSVMQDMVNEYDIWSEGQDVGSIVPVRYHTNLFGRAGHGERFDEQLITEAMWFRASFFDVLGVSPDKCFCSRIKGDSMEPTLIDRGTVLWQMTAVYLGEGIYLFRQYDDIRIKRLHRINRYTYRIVSDSSNKDSYPTEILDLSQSQDYDFEIYGKYLWDCGIAS